MKQSEKRKLLLLLIVMGMFCFSGIHAYAEEKIVTEKQCTAQNYSCENLTGIISKIEKGILAADFFFGNRI